MDNSDEPKDAKAGRLLRLPEVLNRIPISRSAWWEGVRTGKYPQPVNIRLRVRCWRERDIDELVERGVA